MNNLDGAVGRDTVEREAWIDEICDRFEDACRASRRPAIAEFLQLMGINPDSADPNLLRELTRVDAAYQSVAVNPVPTNTLTDACEAPLATLSFRQDDQTASTPPDIDCSAAQFVPGYEILGELGRGGMGVVYKARQTNAARLVALKVIRAGHHASVTELDRFRTEASAIARLQHAHVVQVFDVGHSGELPYFSLEFCSGGNLAQKLAGNPMAPRAAAELVEKLALGVRAAHEAGVVHRDLKPANVLLTADGTPKVTDFGLAKLIDVEGNTGSEAVMGTPSYMAPEQAGGRAKEAGPAVDVYALGAVLYECLTGRPPFKGASTADTLVQVRTQNPVPVRDLVQGVPRDLETICHKCLEKEPARRYLSAGQLGSDLRAFLERRPVTARPVGAFGRFWRWRARNPTLATAAVVAAAALLLGSAASTGFGLWALDNARLKKIEAGNARSAQALAESEADNARNSAAAELTANQKAQTSAAAEHAANQKAQRQLALVHQREGLKLADDGEPLLGLLRLVHPLVVAAESPEAVWMARCQFAAYHRYAPSSYTLAHVWKYDVSPVEFSPDGTRFLTRQAQVWDTDSGKPLSPPLPQDAPIISVRFSPDGTRILTTSEKAARVWDAATGKPLSPPLPHADGISSAAFSRDGTRVLTTSGKSAQVWEVGSGRTLFPPLLHDGPVYASLSPDGARLATCSGSTARLRDARTGEPLAPPLTHVDQIYNATFSPDGKRVLTTSEKTARLWDTGTGRLVSQSLPRPLDSTASFSPDGSRLLTFSGTVARVYDSGSGEPVSPPLAHAGHVVSGSFSPDGTQAVTIALVRTDGKARSSRDVCVWDAVSGKSLAPPITHTDVFVVSATFHPDSKQILTSTDKAVRVWDAASGAPLSPSLGNGIALSHTRFSPDGRRLLAIGLDGTVRVWDAVSNAPLAHAHVSSPAALAPDGRRVVTTTGTTARVWDTESGQALSPPLTHSSPVRAAALSLDGTRVVTISDREARVWDAATGKPLTPSLAHSPGAGPGSFSRDGRRVFTFIAPNTVQVWDADSGRALSSPMRHHEPISSAEFSPDGLWLLTAGGKSAQVWDVATGRSLVAPTQLAEAVLWAAFSPDGKRVLTSSRGTVQTGTVQVWDAVTSLPITPPIRGYNVLLSVFSPDGKRILTVTMPPWPQTVRVWDAESGNPVSPPLRHTGMVHGAAFSPDGKRVVTACDDKTARVWDAESGKPVSLPLPHNGPVSAAEFSPDGKRVVTVCANKWARVWDVDSSRPLSPPLHTDKVFWAGFSSDGTRVIALSRNDTYTDGTFVPEGYFAAVEHALSRNDTASDGTRVPALNRNYTARVWNVTPDDRPAADLVGLAQLLSDYRLDDTEAPTRLTTEEFMRLWTDLSIKYPIEFTVLPAVFRRSEWEIAPAPRPVALHGPTGASPDSSGPKVVKDGPLGMKFVPLPKGTFYMGWDGKEGSAKKTEIKEDFEIGVYTVTQGQWQAVMGKNPSWFSRDGEGKDKVKDIKDEDLKHFPVENVSWEDCQEFIKKLNEQEKGKGWVYRLPNEAESEYACRGGATSEEECSYHFYFAKPTNDLSSKEANFNGNAPFGEANKGPYLERTTKVGSYASNKLGLYDMHGNVWQWCADLYDPKGTEVGASHRVLRSGCWGNRGSDCRAARRLAFSPSLRGHSLGLRLARVPSAPAGK